MSDFPSAAYDAWRLASPDDGPDDDRRGECPVCKGETSNGEEDAERDEDGSVSRSWSWLSCDSCKAACRFCGETGTEKSRENEELCRECCPVCLAEEIAKAKEESGLWKRLALAHEAYLCEYVSWDAVLVARAALATPPAKEEMP
jgi:hypothetical protein